MLLLKAQEYAQVCGCENIEKLDINWINRWKATEEIVCKNLHGEAESVDQFGVDKWQKYCLPIFSKLFKAEDFSIRMKLGFSIDAYPTEFMFSELTNAQVVNSQRKD